MTDIKNHIYIYVFLKYDWYITQFIKITREVIKFIKNNNLIV